MPSNEWDRAVKIHEGCGGVCRWVEAVRTPGLGYWAECLACGDGRLGTQDMIPLEDYRERQILPVAPNATLAGLTWDDDADWDANQARLRAIVDEVVRRPARLAGGDA